MTHELKNIFGAYLINRSKGRKSALATVIKLEGSSYRRPGVRMLLAEDGAMTGAVSGGCVEKEIQRQAEKVFDTGTPLIMTYDGRYRLGCEGILYILIEPFEPAKDVVEAFQKVIANRVPVEIEVRFPEKSSDFKYAGSFLKLNDWKACRTSLTHDDSKSLKGVLKQELDPAFRMVIFGAEHDAVQLSGFAGKTGWEVFVVPTARDPKNSSDFPEADRVINSEPETFDFSHIDEQTAVILMSHSYVRDLTYLKNLVNIDCAYIGILGPVKRREKLLEELISYNPDLPDEFLESIHGPAGLNIGSVTPQEIALSIMAEILSVIRGKEPHRLRDISGTIHQRISS